MKIKVIKKESLTSGNTTVVNLVLTDGYCFSNGDGKARCADGDEFDAEIGEKIACKRAMIKACKGLIKTNQLITNTYEKLLADSQKHTDGAKAYLVKLQNDLDNLVQN